MTATTQLAVEANECVGRVIVFRRSPGSVRFDPVNHYLANRLANRRARYPHRLGEGGCEHMPRAAVFRYSGCPLGLRVLSPVWPGTDRPSPSRPRAQRGRQCGVRNRLFALRSRMMREQSFLYYEVMIDGCRCRGQRAEHVRNEDADWSISVSAVDQSAITISEWSFDSACALEDIGIWSPDLGERLVCVLRQTSRRIYWCQ